MYVGAGEGDGQPKRRGGTRQRWNIMGIILILERA